MRFSISTPFSVLGLILLNGLLLTACGSFQSTSYYSDGIYSNDNVIVVRRNKKTSNTNAYTQYFDQQAKQYTWEDNSDDVALTNVDSLNQGNLKNYQTNANWGGGNKTTQIVIQSSPLFLGYVGNWGFGGGFYDPYVAFWNYNYYNPYYWDRFAWGFNRPFFRGYYPYARPGFFYGDPFFYGNGFWNGYYGYGGFGFAYNRPFNRNFNRVHRNRGANVRNNRAYSSSYRGQAATGRGASINTRAEQQNTNTIANTRNRNSDAVVEVPNLVRQGRTANTRQNLDDTESRVNRTQRNVENANRSQIERVIRNMQNNGYDIQVIENATQARRFSNQNRSQNVVNSGNRSTPQSRSNNSNSNTAKEYSSGRSYSNPSSSRSSNNVRSSSSRSYSAPARVSSGGGRSSSSGASGGRSSSGGRRQ